jgi:hypothetical protein
LLDHSDMCASTRALNFPLSTHFLIVAAFRPISLTTASIASCDGVPFAKIPSMKEKYLLLPPVSPTHSAA